MQRTRFPSRIMLALMVASTVSFVGMSPAAAGGGGQGQSCAQLSTAFGHSLNPNVLKQFVDHGCQPPPPPPFNAPPTCAFDEPPLPPACYPPPLPISIAGGANYDAYPLGVAASHGFTVTNQSGSSFDVTAVVIGGSDASNFRISTDQCSGSSLASGASCNLTVSFAPTAARTFSAVLALSNTATGFVYAQLSGDGPVAPLSFYVNTSPPNTWDYHHNFLPPTVTGDAPDFGVHNYSYAPNYSNVDVTTVDGDGLPYHGSMTATLSSDDCPYQVQGGSDYSFTAADAGAHRFKASLGDRPSFTKMCTLRVHDPAGLIADGTAPGDVVGELCNDADDNGNGAADELYPQVAVTATAPGGTSTNNNPHPAQSVTVGTGAQQRTGAWSCSSDRQSVVPVAGGVVL